MEICKADSGQHCKNMLSLLPDTTEEERKSSLHLPKAAVNTPGKSGSCIQQQENGVSVYTSVKSRWLVKRKHRLRERQNPQGQGLIQTALLGNDSFPVGMFPVTAIKPKPRAPPPLLLLPESFLPGVSVPHWGRGSSHLLFLAARECNVLFRMQLYNQYAYLHILCPLASITQCHSHSAMGNKVWRSETVSEKAADWGLELPGGSSALCHTPT